MCGGAATAGALLSWTRVLGAGIALLLTVAVVLLFDLRWRLGASTRVQRSTLREARDARVRAGAALRTAQRVDRRLEAVHANVERSERRILGSVELASLQARDWQLDQDDAAAARHDRLTAVAWEDPLAPPGGNGHKQPSPPAGEDLLGAP